MLNEERNSDRAPPAVGAYPHARRVGNLLYLSGVGPRVKDQDSIPGVELDNDGNIVSYDIAEQCKSVFNNVKMISEWEILRPKVEALPNMNKAARRLQRLILGNAAPMELDGAGRILVPPTLRSYAHLEKKLMLIGQGKKLELWSEERWFAWLDESSEDDEMPPEMEALSL